MNVEPIQIVLVEDNDDDAELTMRALGRKRLANRVHRLSDGEAAIDYFFVNPGPRPQVILLDLKLPKVHGLEIVKRLKADPATSSIPVVIMTSSNEDRDLFEAYRNGANSYIVKPVAFDKFIDVVESLGFYWLAVNKPPVD